MTTVADAPLKGWTRMAQIARANEAATQSEKARLLAALGCPVSPALEIRAEAIAACWIRCRHLRRCGKDDTAQQRMLRRLMRGTPFELVPAPSPALLQQGQAAHDAVERMFANHPGRKWAIDE